MYSGNNFVSTFQFARRSTEICICGWYLEMQRIAALLIVLLFCSAFPSAGEEITHVMKKGETLFQVSREYHVPLDLLVEANRIADPARVPAGTVLRIPRLHVVKRGETLYGIARQYGVSLDALIAVNEIRDTGRILAGSRLFIPQSGTQATSPPDGKPASPPARTAGAEGFWPHPGPREPFQGRLNGIAIHGEAGDGIRSVSSGRVVWVGPYRGFGRVVFVESPDGYVYVYAGNEHILVEVGEQVRQGTELGRLGRNAHQGGARLIFLVYHNGRPVDPHGAPRI